MKKIFIGLYVSRFCRASALFVMCAMLPSCFVDAVMFSFAPASYNQKYISMWADAGSPPVVRCKYPLESRTPAYPGKMEPQAYTSMRDFYEAAKAAQAPIWECGVIGGSVAEPDAAPDAAQIARMNWGRLGYALLHTWHPGSGYAYYYTGGMGYYVEDPQMGPTYLGDDFKTYTYHEGEPIYHSKELSAAYGAWYLAYQLIPQDNAKARGEGVGLYAMQGFRCAIHMRDFPAARRYWELAMTEPTDHYARLALQSLLQGARSTVDDERDGPNYLNIPQDIRRAAWDAAGHSYSGIEGKVLSMAEVENAAQAGPLRRILYLDRKTGYRSHVPLQSVMYCPVFYPDFDPIPFIHPFDRNVSVPTSDLITAVERADKEAREAREATK